MLSLLLLCVPGNSLLLIWLLLVTLQLIAHTLLLHAIMPQELFLFMRDLLSVARLSFGSDYASSGGFNIWFDEVGYNSAFLTGNISLPMLLLLSISGALVVLMPVIERLVLKGKKVYSKKSKLAKFIRGLYLLAGFTFAYCYLEFALCCLVEVKSAGRSSWILLALASLLFLALPAFVHLQALKKSGDTP